jgi:hypothetical protein
MKERIIHSNITIPSDNQSAIISKPGKSSLDFPTAFVASQLTAITVFLMLVIALVRANQFNASASQTLTKRVTVVAFISNQPFRIFSRTAPTFAWYYSAFFR